MWWICACRDANVGMWKCSAVDTNLQFRNPMRPPQKKKIVLNLRNACMGATLKLFNQWVRVVIKVGRIMIIIMLKKKIIIILLWSLFGACIHKLFYALATENCVFCLPHSLFVSIGISVAYELWSFLWLQVHSTSSVHLLSDLLASKIFKYMDVRYDLFSHHTYFLIMH